MTEQKQRGMAKSKNLLRTTKEETVESHDHARPEKNFECKRCMGAHHVDALYLQTYHRLS